MSDFRQRALDYHAKPTPGKIRVELSKPADGVDDLALAYSPTQLKAIWWRSSVTVLPF